MSGILDVPYVLCVDVGSPKNIGWADSNGRAGDQSTLGQALSYLQAEIRGPNMDSPSRGAGVDYRRSQGN
jgi:hypothetical protein